MQRPGDRRADALRGPGDQGGLAREVDGDGSWRSLHRSGRQTNLDALVGDAVGHGSRRRRRCRGAWRRRAPGPAGPSPGPAHQDDRVGVGEDVPLADRLGHQVVEQDVGRRVEVEAADATGGRSDAPSTLGSFGAVLLAEELAGGPLVLLAEDLVVEVLEELELDRVGEPLGRLDPVDDDPARAPDEVLVEEGDRAAEDAGEVGLPGVPVVGLEVAAGHAAAGAGERVEVVAERPVEVPDGVQVERARRQGSG